MAYREKKLHSHYRREYFREAQMGKSINPIITPLTNEFSTRHVFFGQMSRIRAIGPRLIFLIVRKHASEKYSNVTRALYYWRRERQNNLLVQSIFYRNKKFMIKFDKTVQ